MKKIIVSEKIRFVWFLLLLASAVLVQTVTAKQFFDASLYSGIMEGDGKTFYTLLSPSGPTVYHGKSGCPQQGFDYTRLPQDHWSRSLFDPAFSGGIVYDYTGFQNAEDIISRVQVTIRNPGGLYSASPGEPIDFTLGHQSDLWFHFRIKVPDNYRGEEAVFELVLDEPDRNNWKHAWYIWDWTVFRPIYRIRQFRVDSYGKVDYSKPSEILCSWQVADLVYDYGDHTSGRCIFSIEPDPAYLPRQKNMAGYEIEVAQGIPYSNDDLVTMLNRIESDPRVSISEIGRGGLSGRTGLRRNPPPLQYQEENIIYAIEMLQDSMEPGRPVLFISTGSDYETCGNWVLEGMIEELLEPSNGPRNKYLSRFGVAIIPIENPDAHAWGTCHVRPYGDGMVPLSWAYNWYLNLWQCYQDPEGIEIKNYYTDLVSRISGEGRAINLKIQLHGDLAPHPCRWDTALRPTPAPNPGPDPTPGSYTEGLSLYGHSGCVQGLRYQVEQIIDTLVTLPFCRAYARPFHGSGYHPGPEYPPYSGWRFWEPDPLFEAFPDMVFEIEMGLLYRTAGEDRPVLPPDQIFFPEPIDHGGYLVDGVITSPEVYKTMGREIIQAYYESLIMNPLPTPTPTPN